MADKYVVLPIVKFSYTTTSADRTSPLGWTHLSGGTDLAFIIDRVSVVDEQFGQPKDVRYLKVQRGMEVLEELNLTWLAQEATAGSMHSNNQKGRSSVAVLVKSPCVAVRYPTRTNQVRRFQVKFSSDTDYYKAISILSEIGCPITDSIPTGGPPPSSSHQAKAAGQLRGMQANNFTLASATATRPVHTAPDASGIRPSSAMTDMRPSTVASSSTVSAAPGHVSSSNRTVHVGRQQPIFQRPEQPLPSSSSNLQDRPSTAPLFDPQPLSQLLPPRRELPFAKKNRQNTSRCTTNADAIPPTPARTSTPTNSPRKQIPNRNSMVMIPSSQPVDDSTHAQVQHQSTVYNPTHTRQSYNQPSIPDPFVSNTNDNNRRQLSEVPNTVLNRLNQMPSSSAPPRRLFEPELQFMRTHDTVTMSTQAQAQTPRAFVNPLIAPSPLPTAAQPRTTASSAVPINFTTPVRGPGCQSSIFDHSTVDLSSYLATSHPERTAQLESWICTQLENEAFLALCQDVEGVWRRVAYGL